jgi:putative ABC transport system permease protein
VVRSLDRKLFREIFRMKGQAVAIALIIACGVSSWVSVLIAYRGLKGTRDAYYREYRMADVFAPVKKAPRAIIDRLEEIEGVRRVRPRIVFEVSIDLPELTEPCFGRVLSLPDEETRVINGVYLVKGRWFSGDGNREVILGARFAREHGLDPGDRIEVIMNNRKEALTIVATALSPEFVYMIRGAGDMLPDPVHFTSLWFSNSFAESVFDFQDAANEFVATLDPGARERDVLDAFDRELDRYGGLTAYARSDQISNRFLSDEIEGLKGSATMTPTIFLGVAAFVLHMLLGRLVRTQRTQIAVFRAFGYSTGAISAHYLKLAMLVGTVGAILGSVIGLWFARYILEMYTKFYDFPMLRFSIDPLVVVSGVLVSLTFAGLGALSAARQAAKLDPAEGLRPEAPGVFSRTLLERFTFLWSRLGFVWRMVLRNISRTKRRAALTIGGVALSTSIIFLSFFSGDSMDELLDYEARYVDRHDLKVTFNSERGMKALYEIRNLPGVLSAEPELVMPVKLRNGHRHKRIGIFGLDPKGVQRGLIDRVRGAVPRPQSGLLLTAKLAELLHLSVGDEVEVEVLVGRRQVFTTTVEGTVDEYLGAAAYAGIGTLSGWLDEETALNSVRLLTHPDRQEELIRRLKDIPAVEGVSLKDQTIEIFRETLVASMTIMYTVLMIFAGIISFGVIYNSTRIALAERERTLASMRVLGFTRAEVGAVLMNENYLLTLVGIVPGLLLGMLFCFWMTKAYDTDLFRFPLVIRAESLLISAVAVMFFTLVANLAVRRRIRRLDLVEALKSRE